MRSVSWLDTAGTMCRTGLILALAAMIYSCSGDDHGVFDSKRTGTVRGVVNLSFDVAAHQADVWRLLRTYADQPMSLADACLVRMAELTERCQVFTTDRDFLIYRRKGRHVIPMLAPFDA